MPWDKIGDVPSRVRTHKGTKLTLAQANKWASIYDALKKQPDVENPAGTAWNTWDKLYTKKGSKWVVRAASKTADIKKPTEESTKENIVLQLLEEHSSDGDEQIYAIFRKSEEDDRPGWRLSDVRVLENITPEFLAEHEFWQGEFKLYPVTLEFAKEMVSIQGAQVLTLPEGGIHLKIEEIVTTSVESEDKQKADGWMESVMFIRDGDKDILEIKEAQVPGGHPLVHGVAVSMDISNEHRFPEDVLEKSINTLIGQPLIEGHSDWPYDVKIQDTHGMIVDAWVNKEEKRAEFLAEIRDEKFLYVLENMPHRAKFSVGFKHNYDTEELGEGDEKRTIKVSNDVAFDHLGVTGNPADTKSVLLDVKQKMESKGIKVIVDGAVATIAGPTSDERGGKTMSDKTKDKKDEVETPEEPEEEPITEDPKPEDQDDTEPESQKTAPKSKPPAPDEKSDGSDEKDLEQKVNALATSFEAEQKKNQELEAKVQKFELAEKRRRVEEYVSTLIDAKKKLPGQKDALVNQYLTFSEKQMKTEIDLNEIAANLTDVFGEKAVVEPPKEKEEPKSFEEPDRKTAT